MKCLNYKKSTDNNCHNKCQYNYKDCLNFKSDIFDFSKCRNSDLKPDKKEISEFTQYLNKINVPYKNNDGTFRTMYEILEDIAKIYKRSKNESNNSN